MKKREKIETSIDIEKVYAEYFSKCDLSWRPGACYIRVSTDDQVEYSPTSQLKLILKYALDNHIYIKIENIYYDGGISGTESSKRSSFQKMISNAKSKNKPFDVILVYDFSRFARNKEESVMYKTLLRKKLNIDVISITQPLTEGKERVILESMYEAMDEYYSLNLSENVQRGKHEKAARGEHNGNAPYGYKYDKNLKLLVIDEDRAKIIRFIFNEYVNDPSMNIKRIVMKLNDMGVKPARHDLWCDRTVKLILHNPAYIGKVRYTAGGMNRDYFRDDTEIFDGKHEPIVDMETWNKAQILNNKRRNVYSKYMKPAPKHEHWLRGIIKCGDCGHSMVKFGAVSRKNPHFQCAWYVKGRCKRSHHIKCHVVEEAILEELKQATNKKIEINFVNENNSFDSEINILLNSLKKLDTRLERIKQAYLNEIDSLEEYKENKESITTERKNIENRLKDLEYQNKREVRKEKVLHKCEEAYRIFNDSEIDETIKFDIAHELFDKIVYDKDNEKLIITYK